jgi:2-epi-5-epi-valiolone 7-phosphate 2-epimerase
VTDQIKLGVVEWGLPIEGPYSCKIAAEVGFAGIQLDVGSYQRNFPITKRVVQQAYLEAAAQFGIEYPAIGCNALDIYSMVAPKGFPERAIAFKTITSAIDAAAAMRIPVVMIQSFKASAIETEQDFERAINVFSEVCEYALDKGQITLGMENLLSVDNLIRLIDEVGKPNLKVFFDTQNYYLDAKVDTAAMVEPLMPHICTVHVKDGYAADIEPSGALLGEGDSRFFDTIAELRRCGYSGWLISENFYDRGPIGTLSDDPVELMSKDCQTMKRVAW